jgi:hypothetical protein
MSLDVIFAPQLPVWLILLIALAAVFYLGLSLIAQARGTLWRMAALAAAILALANPAILQEEREPLADVAVVVTDQSQSQSIGQRTGQAAQALAQLKARLAAIKGLQVRYVQAGEATQRTEGGGTALFRPLAEALADVPPDRVAGAILITDGRVHDAPAEPKGAFPFPIHALLTGTPGERDRKLTIVQAPRYGIVGETLKFSVRVDDFGAERGSAAPVDLEVRVNGEVVSRQSGRTGGITELPLILAHGGESVIEINASAGASELTLLNNRAAVVTTGVRDQLKVLLISGAPHAGERTWRNLLKADPGVSLVHFTILRPSSKDDGTPTNELSLIRFPTDELFERKLSEFNLIIFDRYQHSGLIPMQYYANMARYVEDGGALLVAAGSELADPISLYNTPISSVLPAEPAGRVIETGFRPRLTAAGFRHPVTAGLPGANTPQQDPSWGRWFRLVRSTVIKGQTVMSGPENQPLLVLDRMGQGRVALMLSDHAWLWTRGFEGGGPQAELLRRLAHWLMKEPDLEEERLSAEVRGDRLTIVRRTMGEKPADVELTTPSGQTQKVTLTESQEGTFSGTVRAGEMGLYRLKNGDLTTVAAAGPLNPKEFADVRATTEILSPVAGATRAGVAWIADGVPDIRRVAPGRAMAGDGWFGLRANETYAVRSVRQTPLLHPAIALVLLAGALFMAWRTEGR